MEEEVWAYLMQGSKTDTQQDYNRLTNMTHRLCGSVTDVHWPKALRHIKEETEYLFSRRFIALQCVGEQQLTKGSNSALSLLLEAPTDRQLENSKLQTAKQNLKSNTFGKSKRWTNVKRGWGKLWRIWGRNTSGEFFQILHPPKESKLRAFGFRKSLAIPLFSFVMLSISLSCIRQDFS